MKLPIYQIDAFTSSIFEGNPAAIILLEEWITNKLMQRIALENNLSETAFILKSGDNYQIRWFTPVCEMNLCGHAALAAAHLILYILEPNRDSVTFTSKSGELEVKKDKDLLSLKLPAIQSKKITPPEFLVNALGKTPVEVYQSEDIMVIYKNEQEIKELNPNFSQLKEIDTRGIITTAPGNHQDFVSRFFAPAIGINEDPVTGSAHTKLVPYWSNRLKKKELHATQLSSRSGHLICRDLGEYIELLGNARIYLTGEINTQ